MHGVNQQPQQSRCYPCALHWEVRELRILAPGGAHVDKADVKGWHKCYGGHQSGRLWRHNSHFSISVPLLRYVSFHLSHLITGLRKRNLILLTRTHTLFYKKPNKVLCRHPAHYLDAEKSSGKIIIIKKKNHQVFNLLSSTYSSLHSCDLKSARARSFKGLSGPTHSIQRHLPKKESGQNFLAQPILLQWL